MLSLLALAHGLPADQRADAQQHLVTADADADAPEAVAAEAVTKTWDPTNHKEKVHNHNECEEKAKISSAWCCTCKKCARPCTRPRTPSATIRHAALRALT